MFTDGSHIYLAIPARIDSLRSRTESTIQEHKLLVSRGFCAISHARLRAGAETPRPVDAEQCVHPLPLTCAEGVKLCSIRRIFDRKARVRSAERPISSQEPEHGRAMGSD